MAKQRTPVIGKNIIESLTLGMYENPLCIYREYIQNAADAIDKFKSLEIPPSDASFSISIHIDDKNNEILIEDDGIGVPQANVYETLTDIAASTKEAGKDKGFRGIGRLAGLAYCEKLIFETSYAGEPFRSVLEWDANRMRALIADRKTPEHAAEVIQKITHLSTEKESEAAHYFKVHLVKATEEKLLDTDIVKEYLSFVAPVRYRSGFNYHSKIKQYMTNNGHTIDEYAMLIDGQIVEKIYQTYLYIEKNGKKERYDDVRDVVFISDTTPDGDTLYWGWYSLTALEKQIPSCNPGRGIRLRKENIQIGDELALAKLFKEPRGTRYFLGEIFAVHPELIPNSQRDYFSVNETVVLFEESLRKKFSELDSLYHLSSTTRNHYKKINSLITAQTEFSQKSQEGFTGKDEAKKLQADLEAKAKEAESAKSSLSALYSRHQDDTTTAKMLNIIKEKLEVKSTPCKSKAVAPRAEEKIKLKVDKYSHLKKQERKLVSTIYEVINNVLPKDLAANLIEKIDETLSK
ncbi:ATP-binding protein [Desulfovibrio desulfuricans]|uniref:ATP-binding protein n=1 Tax=Desulfovibrio desulfuricans TaxID=876 RepID=UPI001D0742F1|nr:ATP-binding protein [Desulfovibrio desulfuricans]MCB6540551.1 ATP-binding protein [Desulfovibrio desulfuricans]MCB6551633.1 ATP-binding protein [Desulfovibrio desulfuricans]MCB6563476.1 ATP-binding protein [Desulfovibrio desulfuricans]MCB7344935.1 ATP-binding protein [Desulfovibrio desulfuricans]MCQ4860083.1 ATP-binding protein [Desulfovibrio desulfuricans]